MTNMKQRKRSRFRRLTSFSLRTALVATTVLAVWLGLHMNSVKKQRAAVEAVERNGGVVEYSFEGGLMRDESPVPSWLLNALGHDHFYSVKHAVVHDKESLRQLAAFPRLKTLWTTCPQLGETELRHISQLKYLETLGTVRLQESGQDIIRITDDDLSHLKGLVRLKKLVLSDSLVTDDGLRHLAGMTHLENITLSRSKVDDASWLRKQPPNCVVQVNKH